MIHEVDLKFEGKGHAGPVSSLVCNGSPKLDSRLSLSGEICKSRREVVTMHRPDRAGGKAVSEGFFRRREAVGKGRRIGQKVFR